MNKEKKYTPGPWIPDLTPGDIHSPIGDVAVAVYAGMTRIEVTGKESTLAPISRDEAYANARLIASAPNLLAELESIASADPNKWDAEVRDQFREWAQSRARAAITAATEETK